jgi:hypothetical protein
MHAYLAALLEAAVCKETSGHSFQGIRIHIHTRACVQKSTRGLTANTCIYTEQQMCVYVYTHIHTLFAAIIGAAICEEASRHAIQRQRDSARRTRSLYVMFDYARFKAVHLFRNREAQEVRHKLAVTGNLVLVEGNSEAVGWGVDGWGNQRNNGELPEVEREFAVYPEREFSVADLFGFVDLTVFYVSGLAL